MKKFIIAVAALLVALPSFAQISEGEPSARKIRTGNRLEEGTWGLYMGLSSDIVAGWTSVSNFHALPIINIKYMVTDKWEVRAGIETMGTFDNSKGEVSGTKSSVKKHDGLFRLSPGFAYHFSKKNILDVYAGAELPFGYNAYSNVLVSGAVSNKVKANQFTIGLGAFIGLQCFIANLPIALGLEYGISANANLGGQYKLVTDDGAGNKATKYYASKEMTGTAYDKLGLNNGVLGSQVRLTLSYFFK